MNEFVYRGRAYRHGSGDVVLVRAGEGWWPVTLQELRRAGGARSALWTWLREMGITRPSPSGPSGPNLPSSKRKTAGSVRLTEKADECLEALSERWQASRQECVERALSLALEEETGT